MFLIAQIQSRARMKTKMSLYGKMSKTNNSLSGASSSKHNSTFYIGDDYLKPKNLVHKEVILS